MWLLGMRFSQAIEVNKDVKYIPLADELRQELFDSLTKMNFRKCIKKIYNINSNPAITKKEIEIVINEIRNTAPGIDGIMCSMIQHLPLCAIRSFNKQYKEFLKPEKRVPEELKTHIIIPLLKHGKGPTI